ncbi:hypothetical protein TNCV_4948051 [Trichonephila clavipes]|nr:hypothetical protein TNCV_4948051 [Trichonephila clavipes]
MLEKIKRNSIYTYRVLANSTDKFRGMIASSMGMTNNHIIWGCKPHENHDNSSCREDDEPDEGRWPNECGDLSTEKGLKKAARMKISHFFSLQKRLIYLKYVDARPPTGVEWKFGEGVPAQMSSSSLNPGFKL